MAQNGAGGNIKPQLKTISNLIGEIETLVEGRTSTNEELASIRNRLKNEFGIPKDVLTFVLRYKQWDEPKRRQFDMALALVRESIGMPLEPDLFENLIIPTPENLGTTEEVETA